MTEEKKKSLKTNLIVISVCLIVSFVVLMICSQNSFLYAFNDWVDMNWYVTIGRGIASGKVVYRDLYEQKGPVVYLIFAFMSLFGNTYLACFFLEVICGTIYMYFTYKFLNEFVSKYSSMVGAALVITLTYVSTYFGVGGGAVEEYFLPVIAYLNYRIFVSLKTPERDLSKKECILIGVLIAMSFWSKYTITVLLALVMLMWFVYNLAKKNFKQTLIKTAIMLASFISFGALILLYFVACGGSYAVHCLFHDYFYLNIVMYTDGESYLMTLFKKFFSYSGWSAAATVLALALVLAMIIYAFIKHRKAFYCFVPFVVMLFLLIFSNKPYVYYSLILVPYLAYAVVPVFQLAGRVFSLLTSKPIRTAIIGLVSIVMPIILVHLSFICGNCTQNLGKKQSDYLPYQVVSDIYNSGEEDTKVYCYMILDVGIYNVANQIPEERFFVRNNFYYNDFPEMYDYMNSVAKSKKYNFLVTNSTGYDENKTMLEKNYDIYNTYEADDGGQLMLLIRKKAE